jgi:hypothetical protein
VKPIIQAQKDWNGKASWYRRHESGLFGLEIAVHSERDEPSSYCAPRIWNSYLVGSDLRRCYRGDVPERWVERCPITDLVFTKGEKLFADLPWNGGPTAFERSSCEDALPEFAGYRKWKVGDDYAHLWDGEWGAWNAYDFEYIRRRIERVAEAFFEDVCRPCLETKKEVSNGVSQ